MSNSPVPSSKKVVETTKKASELVAVNVEYNEGVDADDSKASIAPANEGCLSKCTTLCVKGCVDCTAKWLRYTIAKAVDKQWS